MKTTLKIFFAGFCAAMLVFLCMGAVTTGPITTGTISNLLNGVFIPTSGGSGTNLGLWGTVDFPAAGDNVLLRDFTVTVGADAGLILYSKNTAGDNPVLAQTGLFTTDGSDLTVPGALTADGNTEVGGTLEVDGSATLNDNLRFANPDTGIILDLDTMMFVRSDNGEIILGSGGEPGFDLSTPNWAFNDGYAKGLQANQQIILNTNVIGQTFNAQTTSDTVTTLAEIPLPEESAVTMTAKVTGAQSSYANVNGYGITATAKNNGGTSGLVVSQTKWHEKEDQAGWECIIDVDDTADSIRVRVTGAAATTINWSVTLDIVWVR